jgi:hypothetical protein
VATLFLEQIEFYGIYGPFCIIVKKRITSHSICQFLELLVFSPA